MTSKEMPAVILGSYKPERWDSIVRVYTQLLGLGVSVYVPKDINLTEISLEDNRDFYFLQADLEEAGLTTQDLKSLTTNEATERLNFRKLERRNYKIMSDFGKACLTYVITNDGKLGKSTAYELSLSALLNNRIALDSRPTKISVEIGIATREFLCRCLSDIPVVNPDELCIDNFKFPHVDLTDIQKLYLMREALAVLQRKHFIVYERPKEEFIEFPH